MSETDKLDHTILFIEDEIDTRKNYVRYLKRYFIEVYEAGDGEEALQIYKEKKPDILIIDINIPKLNGLELLKRIRQNDHSTKALMLTAHSDKEFLLKAAELKLTKYLVKPVTRDELKDALHLVIDEIEKFKTTGNKLEILKDGFIWNNEKKELFKDHNLVHLTPKEKKLFELLISNSGQVFSYDDIIIYVWDSFDFDKMNALKSLTKKLRNKLPDDSIVNVYAEGLKLVI